MGGGTYKAGDKITVKWKTENIPSDTFMQIAVYRINSNNTPYLGFNTYPDNAIHNVAGAPDNMTLNDGSETIFVDFPKDYSTGTDFKIYVRRILYNQLTQRVTDDSLLDWSDNYFTITSSTTKCDSSTTPWIKVLSQNTTGISYFIGQTIPVKWETCNIPSTANMALDIVNTNDSMDYPGSITVLNTGQGNYTIPNKNISNNSSSFPAHLGQAVYKVRVDSKIPSLSYNLEAYSDNLFTITSSTSDTGCKYGFKYSPTTGKLCPVLTPTTNTTTAVNNLINSCGQTLFTNLLRIGSKGDQAESLQVLLNDQGYLSDDEIDGSFGYKTWKALKAFQIANGLKGDGIMGQQTRAYFNTLWNKQCLAD